MPRKSHAARFTSLVPVKALPPALPTPHPAARIVPVTDAHIGALRRINSLLLPVSYTDAFYKSILDPSQSGLFSRVILFEDEPGEPPIVVGGIICRLEPSPFDPQDNGRYSPGLAHEVTSSVAPPPVGLGHALYIQSLVLLSPYRGLGLAAAAIEGIFDAVRTVTRERRGNGLNIKWVYAHVWTENEEGLAWYARRGFERDVRLEGYYFKLEPGTAWVVKRRVFDGDEDERPWCFTVLRQGANPVGNGHVPHVMPDARPLSVTAAAVNNGHVSHAQPDARPVSVTAAAVNLSGFTPINIPRPAAPPKSSTRTPLPSNSLTFQIMRPDMVWNDLPRDMVAKPPARNSARGNILPLPIPSGAASGSSSATGRKKRAYPTAAFGN